MCYTVEHNVFVDRTGIINNVRGAHNSSSTRSPNPNPADALGPAAGESTFIFHFFFVGGWDLLRKHKSQASLAK